MDTLDELKENLLEEFTNCISDKIALYLNKQKVTSSSETAVLADEFVLTHKTVFPSSRCLDIKLSE